MVIPSPYLDFLRERIDENIAEIRYLSRNIGELNRLRELFPDDDDWEIQEMTMAMIFDEAQVIEALRKEVERDQRAIRGIKKRRAARGPA